MSALFVRSSGDTDFSLIAASMNFDAEMMQRALTVYDVEFPAQGQRLVEKSATNKARVLCNNWFHKLCIYCFLIHRRTSAPATKEQANALPPLRPVALGTKSPRLGATAQAAAPGERSGEASHFSISPINVASYLDSHASGSGQIGAPLPQGPA